MILQRMSAAFFGQRAWLRIQRKYDVNNGVYVLLMPENDQELNELALKHMDDLIEYRRARGVVILTNNNWVLSSAKQYSERLIEVVPCSSSKLDQIISAYEFYHFSERLLIVSLTRPYGSKLFRALGVNGVTKEDLVCLCILLMRNWSSKEGGNEQLREVDIR